LLDLQAPKVPSVALVRKLQTWSAVVLSKDLAKLRAARLAVTGSPLVKDTESILNAWDNHEWLAAHKGELPAIQWAQPAAVTAEDLPRLAAKARALADRLAAIPESPPQVA